ncbi:N/A [soil metagenome]
MRLFALAQAWLERGAGVTLITAQCPDSLLRRFQDEGAASHRLSNVGPGEAGGTEDLEETCRVVLNSPNASRWLAVDGYQFSAGYQDVLSSREIPVLWVDDSGGCSHYRARWILNQNGQADASIYQARQDDTELLLGSRYTLLRSEFTRFRGELRHYPARVRRVIVSMGGADEGNVTSLVLEALENIGSESNNFKVVVVLGALNPHCQDTLRQIERSSLNCELVQDATSLADLFAGADLGIIAPGTTLQETQFLGLPCVLVVVADNQSKGAEFAERNGLAILADLAGLQAQITRLLHDESLRRSLGEAGRALIDGRGRDRVVAALLGLTDDAG